MSIPDRPPGSALATLYPGYFALVMATGIIAVGAQQQELVPIAQGLYAVASLAYTVLIALFAARIAGAGDRVMADVVDHSRGFAFLTIVAGTNVLASVSIVVHGWRWVAWWLWWWSVGLWVVVLYPTLIAAVIGRNKPGLAVGVNGSWFLPTVATQSIAVTAGLLLTRWRDDRLAFAALAAGRLGIILYVIVMTMVFLHWTFHALEPSEIEPPAWITAGAVAIAVLAGSSILLAADAGPARLTRVAPFVEGFVVLAWTTATFWLPLMVAIGVWRHAVRRVPLRYHPGHWAMIFPLGMYGVATQRMVAAIDFPALAWLPAVVLPVALGAWSLTGLGLVRQLVALAGGADGRRLERGSGRR